MALINKLMVGESLVGDGNEVAHIDLLIGPRQRRRAGFRQCSREQQGRFTTLLAVVAPNLWQANTILFNKVTIRAPSRPCRCLARPRPASPSRRRLGRRR